jgi:mycofactocin glycosyltransferase
MRPLSTNKDCVAHVVIPVYNERPEALAATLRACIAQACPFEKIFVVDDGSPTPVLLPEWARSCSQISLLRLEENRGIAAARNTAIASSDGPLLACVNCEVLPDADWLSTCKRYLSSKPNVGACYTRLVAQRPNRLLSRWRMRFLETKFGEESGVAPFAPGHAVLFRREAVDQVGGYDVYYRSNFEDGDICLRMKNLGWETHYVAESRCVSIQRDLLRELATKELRETGWLGPHQGSLVKLCLGVSKWTVVRAFRNLVKGRFSFLPVDAAVWAAALWIATTHALRQISRRHGR